MLDIHAAIASVLAAHPLRPLGSGEDGPAAASINKAGILLFLPAQTTENWRFCVIRPLGKAPQLGPPPFQLPKGTRMQRKDGKWTDIGRNDEITDTAEPLAATALREAVEEAGLSLPNLSELWDTGPVSFASASTGKPKWMWLFAGELKKEDDFLPISALSDTTAAREFLTLWELPLVREDHGAIIKNVMARLVAHHRL